MTEYSQQLPPEIQQFIEKVRSLWRTKKRGGPAGLVIIVLLILIASFSSFYTIEPEEAGVVLRFGKYVETTSPGLHFKLPFGIDRVEKVKVTTVRKEEFGFRTASAGVQSQYRKGEQYEQESLMLSGDLNVADVEWIVQFQVNDPYKFLYKVRNVKKNLRDVSEAAMRLVVGDRSVSDVLTVGRVIIADQVKIKMQETYDHYGMGIKITNVILQDVNPPQTVKASFNEVNAAKQEQDQMVNEAWEAYNKAVPEERGKAEQTVAVAEGYALERINNAQGEAKRFRILHRAYQRAPEVTKTRIYLEKMEQILGRADKVFIMDPAAKTLLPHFNLKDLGGLKGGAQ